MSPSLSGLGEDKGFPLPSPLSEKGMLVPVSQGCPGGANTGTFLASHKKVVITKKQKTWKKITIGTNIALTAECMALIQKGSVKRT